MLLKYDDQSLHAAIPIWKSDSGASWLMQARNIGISDGANVWGVLGLKYWNPNYLVRPIDKRVYIQHQINYMSQIHVNI